MSDSHVHIVCYYERDIAYVVTVGVSHDSNFPPLARDHMGHKVISLTDDSNLETTSGNSLEEGASSFNSSESLLSDDGGKEDRAEVPMPPPILIDVEI